MVADSAKYKCKNSSLVTNLGPVVEIPCVFKPENDGPSFDWPPEWGTKGTKCREPVLCKPVYDPPLDTGLSLLHEYPYYEFEKAKFR